MILTRLCPRPGAARRPVGHRPLRLEHLEDRTTPSIFTVTTTADVVDTTDGKFSLRVAVTRANALPGADVIVVPAGVYQFADPSAGESDGTSDLDITSALTIWGAGAGLTIIDAQQKDRVFDVLGSNPSSIKVVLQGLTIRNGLVTGPGGGILVGNADLVVRDSAITDHRASGFGGGISNSDLTGTGNVKVVRTTVARNVSGRSGGGISVVGDPSVLTLKDSSVRRNLASGVGGGISATTVTLTKSTINGNSATSDTSEGGGIFATTATLTSCTVGGNSAGFAGGGIKATTATLTSCTINGNSATSDTSEGGGIRTDATATLTSCTVGGNSAGFAGGGIKATTATLTSCTISRNAVTSDPSGGGGIFAFAVTLTNCTVSGNSAQGTGGGIVADVVMLTNCTVSGNSAQDIGGGISAFTLTLTNCTVSGNSAGRIGGGIAAPTATLINCTIAENSAHTGGGLFHTAANGTFKVKNSIVALNLTDFGGTGPDVAGDPFTSQGHNLIGDGTGFTAGTGDILGTAANRIDPKLGPLANNGGRTKTHKLLAGSRAIDAGDNSLLPPTDQRGLPRRKDGNGDGRAFVDIGAFER